jgi:hypothetical protein
LGLLDKYKDGIRVMGIDVIKSAINSKLYDAAKSVITFCENNNILIGNEIKFFNSLFMANKMKLYNLPFLYNKLIDRVDRIEGKKNSYLCLMNHIGKNNTN